MDPLSRAARLLSGLCLCAVAFALVLNAHLGLGPWHVLQQGLAHHLHLSLGHAAWVMAGGLLAVAMALGTRPGPGTFVIVLLGGQILDLVVPHVGTPHGIPLRLLTLALGTTVMSFGAALMISADVGISPLDSLMTGLYRHLRRVPLFAVRLGLEVLGLLLGWWAGGEVGVGCVVVGVGIGPGIHFFLDRMRAMPDRAPLAVAAGA